MNGKTGISVKRKALNRPKFKAEKYKVAWNAEKNEDEITLKKPIYVDPRKTVLAREARRYDCTNILRGIFKANIGCLSIIFCILYRMIIWLFVVQNIYVSLLLY